MHDCNEVRVGMSVKVGQLRHDESEMALQIHQKHVSVRRPNIEGSICGVVPCHGAEVWYVQHKNSPDIGVYSLSEMSPA